MDDLRQELDNGDFEKRLQGLEGEQQQVAVRLAKLHERRGELSQQLKTMADDQAGMTPHLEQERLREQMAQVSQRWLVLAGISLALDSVRKSYESERQPETLAEASSYLKRLTTGRYQRIWTPFGESALCVDDQQGQARRVEALSRGTREQVYLSLRLALASAYSRRGAGLPLILDDVFVNFDAERARAAAETVCDFAAAGHQVLVFTCHDHIRDEFRALDVDIRCLPKPEDVAESGRPVLREVAMPPESPPPDPVTVAAAEEPTNNPVAPRLPTEDDPELDQELLYGAPQYDPGYGLPRRPASAPPGPAPAESAADSEGTAEAYLAGYRDALHDAQGRDPRPDEPPAAEQRAAESGLSVAYADYDHWPLT